MHRMHWQDVFGRITLCMDTSALDSSALGSLHRHHIIVRIHLVLSRSMKTMTMMMTATMVCIGVVWMADMRMVSAAASSSHMDFETPVIPFAAHMPAQAGSIPEIPAPSSEIPSRRFHHR